MNIKREIVKPILYIAFITTFNKYVGSIQIYVGGWANCCAFHSKVKVKGRLPSINNLVRRHRYGFNACLRLNPESDAHLCASNAMQRNIESHCTKLKSGFPSTESGLIEVMQYATAALNEALRTGLNPTYPEYQIHNLDPTRYITQPSWEKILREYQLDTLTQPPIKGQLPNEPLRVHTDIAYFGLEVFGDAPVGTIFSALLHKVILDLHINTSIEKVKSLVRGETRQALLATYLQKRVVRNVPSVAIGRNGCNYTNVGIESLGFSEKIAIVSDAAFLAREAIDLENLCYRMRKFPQSTHTPGDSFVMTQLDQADNPADAIASLVDQADNYGNWTGVSLVCEDFNEECEVSSEAIKSMDLNLVCLGLAELTDSIKLGLFASVGKSFRGYEFKDIPIKLTEGLSFKAGLVLGYGDLIQFHAGFNLTQRFVISEKSPEWEADLVLAESIARDEYLAQFGGREMDSNGSDMVQYTAIACYISLLCTFPIKSKVCGFFNFGYQTDLHGSSVNLRGAGSEIYLGPMGSMTFGLGVLMRLK